MSHLLLCFLMLQSQEIRGPGGAGRAGPRHQEGAGIDGQPSVTFCLHVLSNHLQSREIMDLVELIGLGDGNKKALGKLKNDVRRNVRKTFSPKTRDVLKHVEERMNVRPFSRVRHDTNRRFSQQETPCHTLVDPDLDCRYPDTSAACCIWSQAAWHRGRRHLAVASNLPMSLPDRLGPGRSAPSLPQTCWRARTSASCAALMPCFTCCCACLKLSTEAAHATY